MATVAANVLKVYQENKRSGRRVLDGNMATMPDNLPGPLLEELGILAAKIEIAMYGGNFEHVRSLVDQSELTFNTYQPKGESKLNDPIDELGLQVRTCNALNSIEVYTVRELLSIPECVIRCVPNVGVKTVEEIMECLKKHGYIHGKTRNKIEKLEKTGFRKPKAR